MFTVSVFVHALESESDSKFLAYSAYSWKIQQQFTSVALLRTVLISFALSTQFLTYHVAILFHILQNT